MDPDPKQIVLASEIKADRIELYTGPYAWEFDKGSTSACFLSLHQRYLIAAQKAVELGLGVNAGHDLNLRNLSQFMQIPHILEVSIGHAFTIDSLISGMKKTTRDYLEALGYINH